MDLYDCPDRLEALIKKLTDLWFVYYEKLVTKIFDVQGRKFTSVTCTKCRYTEFYQADSSKLGSIFDLFTN